MSEIKRKYLAATGAPATIEHLIAIIVDGMCVDKIIAPKRAEAETLIRSIIGYEAVEDILMEVVSSTLTEADMVEIMELREKYPVLTKAMGVDHQSSMDNMYKKRLSDRFEDCKADINALIDKAYDEEYARKAMERKGGA